MAPGASGPVPGSVLEPAAAAAALGSVQQGRPPVYGLSAEFSAICTNAAALARKAQCVEEGDIAVSVDHVSAAIEGEEELRCLVKNLDRRLTECFGTLQSSIERIGQQLRGSPGSAINRCAGDYAAFSSKSLSSSWLMRPTSSLRRAMSPEPSMRGPTVEESMTRSPSMAISKVEDADATKFTLRSEWQIDPKKHCWARPIASHDVFKQPVEFANDHEVGSIDPSTLKPWYLLWPSGHFRLTWDLTTMALVAHDMAVIPVHMGFGTDDNIVSKILFFPFLLFWTLDIPLSFLTGYYCKGQVETNLRQIAKNYILSWFVLDIAMVTSGWTEAVLGMRTNDQNADQWTEGLELGRVGKTLRILQIGRSMRLLRLVKLRRILEDIQDRITSEYFHIVIAVLRLSVITVWTNHFIACTWWGIGNSGPREGAPDAQDSWTSHFQFQRFPLPYQYFTSLHWSLTQFTPASMEVSPRNLGERMFAVFVLVFAMIVFSSFVSSITAAMTQLRNLGKPVDKSFVVLRRYLRGRKIPIELNQRIVKCVQSGLKAKKEQIPESDVDLLKFLSPSLHMELLSHVYAPALTRHPFFARYGATDPIALQRMCLRAVKRVYCAAGDVVFTAACTGDHMFFILRGKFRYLPARGTAGNSDYSDDAEESNTMVRWPSLSCHGHGGCSLGTEEWFCEPSLWSAWAHTGTMRAQVFSEVLAVDPIELAKVTSLRRLVHQAARRYGQAFVERLNYEAAQGIVSDVRPMDADSIDDLAEEAFLPTRKVPQKEPDEVVQQGSGLGTPRTPRLSEVPVPAEINKCCKWIADSIWPWGAGSS